MASRFGAPYSGRITKLSVVSNWTVPSRLRTPWREAAEALGRLGRTRQSLFGQGGNVTARSCRCTPRKRSGDGSARQTSLAFVVAVVCGGRRTQTHPGRRFEIRCVTARRTVRKVGMTHTGRVRVYSCPADSHSPSVAPRCFKPQGVRGARPFVRGDARYVRRVGLSVLIWVWS
jgi:hypothetical protein